MDYNVKTPLQRYEGIDAINSMLTLPKSRMAHKYEIAGPIRNIIS